MVLVNTREALLNRRHKGQAQDADTLGPKGTWSGPEAPNSSGTALVPPAERRNLTHTVIAAERGKPVVSPADCVLASDSQEKPKGRRVREEGASESRSVMGRTGVEPQGDIIPRRKPADFPLVLAYVNHGQTDSRKQSR